MSPTSPVEPKPNGEEAKTKDAEPALNVVRVSFAVILTVVFLIFTGLLYAKSDTKDALQWERLVYLFGAIEALAFTAIGWVFGREVNRQRADAAEKRASDASTEKEAEKVKGAKLAGLVAGESGSGGRSSLQPQGPGGGADSSLALEYARQHYGV